MRWLPLLLLAAPLAGQTNGSDTISATPWAVGPGASTLQACRELGGGLKVHKVSENLRNGGSGLRALLNDSVQSTRLDVILNDTSKWDREGSYDPNGTSDGNCLIVTAEVDQGSGQVMTAATHTWSVWTNITIRNDTNTVWLGGYVRAMNDDGVVGAQGANIRFTSGQYLYMHGMSLTCADDKEIVTTGVPNVTVSNFLIRGCFYGHTTAIAGGGITDDFLMYRTVCIRCKKRVPRLGGPNGVSPSLAFINFGAYEWKGDTRSVKLETSATRIYADFVGNRFKPGPGTDTGKEARVMSYEWHTGDSDSTGFPKIYDKDIIHGGASQNTTYTGTPPDDVHWSVDKSGDVGSAGKDSVFQSSSQVTLVEDYPVRDTADASAMIPMFDSLGFRARVACDGEKSIRAQDYIDEAATTAAEDSTSLVDYSDIFPADSVKPAAGCTDDDDDGLPDDFEFRVAGDSTSAEPDSLTASGYLMIEHYIYGLTLPSPLSDGADTTTYVDSSFAAIKRDCGNPMGMCVPSEESGGLIPEIMYLRMILQMGMIAVVVLGIWMAWKARQNVLQRRRYLERLERVRRRELYAKRGMWAAYNLEPERAKEEIDRMTELGDDSWPSG